jgi:glyceraldehyde 3-phosphate dehydrogenase
MVNIIYKMAAAAQVKLGINGFGRIGRLVTRTALVHPNATIVAVNDPFMDLDYMVYLLKYDSVHGRFNGDVSTNGTDLVVDGLIIKVFKERNPEDIPWGTVGVDYVAECSGVYTERGPCEKHIQGGAKKVIISAPPKDDVPMFVMGVNHLTYTTD